MTRQGHIKPPIPWSAGRRNLRTMVRERSRVVKIKNIKRVRETEEDHERLGYGLGQGCPTRGLLEEFVRPFIVLSSFTTSRQKL